MVPVLNTELISLKQSTVFSGFENHEKEAVELLLLCKCEGFTFRLESRADVYSWCRRIGLKWKNILNFFASDLMRKRNSKQSDFQEYVAQLGADWIGSILLLEDLIDRLNETIS